MLQRLRWRSYSPVAAEGHVDRAVMARTYAFLFGAGGALVLVTAALSADDFKLGTVLPAVAAFGVVIVALTGYDRLPVIFYEALPGFGAILITVVAVSAGTSNYNAYALLYFWVIVSASFLFAWRPFAASLALSALGYAIVLLSHDEASSRLLFWVMGIGTLAVSGILIALLRDRAVTLLDSVRESDRLKTAILRSVSHDLRTPLTAIIAAGESSASPTLDEASRREVSAVIVDEASRLSGLVDKLLDISKLEGGAAAPRGTWCSLEEVIGAALERMPEGGRRFDVAPAQDLPSVWADESQLERAFSNLFENSSRFSGNGQVKITFDSHNESVLVRVADHGPGVVAEDLERIFEPFYRGKTANAPPRGTGLGLAIAKGFLEANGGRVWVESPAGGGATFVVELPVTSP